MAVTYNPVRGTTGPRWRISKLEIVAFSGRYEHVDAAYAAEHNIMVTTRPTGRFLTEEWSPISALGLLTRERARISARPTVISLGLWTTQGISLTRLAAATVKVGMVGMAERPWRSCAGWKRAASPGSNHSRNPAPDGSYNTNPS